VRLTLEPLGKIASIFDWLLGSDEVGIAAARRANLNVANMQRRGAAETHNRAGVGKGEQQDRQTDFRKVERL
jgi:hypothetical protein